MAKFAKSISLCPNLSWRRHQGLSWWSECAECSMTLNTHLAVVGVLDCFVVVDQVRVVPVGEQLLLPPVVVHLVVQRVLVVHRIRLGQAGGCNKIFVSIFCTLFKNI